MHIKEKLQTFCKELRSHALQAVEKVENIDVAFCGYKQGHTPPESGWQPLDYLVGAHKHCWLRFSFRTPDAIDGTELVLECATGIKGWDANNPQGLLYLNGEMIQGLDINHTESFLEPDTQYEAFAYLYTAAMDAPFLFSVRILRRYTEIDGLFYDLLTPLEALELLNPNATEYKQILTHLEQAVNLVDMREPHSEAYFASVVSAREFLKAEFYDRICSPESKPTVHCIGHTHIDVEWLWTRAQTREKIQRSFATANALMERYPEYPFTLSQPELYRYLKEEAPEKYAQLKHWVDIGRWEPEGSMWVECDCNLVSGESFVRQLLHGKQFFREEFGKENSILLLPDVFGYSAALPQILKKSGVDYFVTSKISWNDTNTMPMDAFYWQGIDGTEVFTNFITARAGLKDHTTERKTTYHATLDAGFVMGCYDRFHQKEYLDRSLLLFGYGDGGGGPTREDLEKQRRLAKGIPGLPVTKMDFLLPYLQSAKAQFDENCKKLGRTPRWVGELYLEFHRGTYTSVAKNKRHNRKSEFLLQKSETLNYTDLLLGGSYDADGLQNAWRTVLHNQFHDILPGSSIRPVYDGTDEDYAQVQAYCDDQIANKLHTIAQGLNTEGGILVYNSLGFARTGTICVDGKTMELDTPIPAFGWQVVQPQATVCGVTIDGLTAENRHYVLRLDKQGRIVSLWDKAARREVFKAPANTFTAYEDLPFQHDNWELADYYRAKAYSLAEEAIITPIFDGSRAGFRIEHRYLSSAIVQQLWLYSDSRRIDFDHDIDWQHHHQVLKLAFPLDIHANDAAFEIQFGHVRRPTHRNTSWDAARFEVCAQKWVDVSENGYGAALLNDCKYGHSVDGSTLELTVLKAGTYPTDEVDIGKHTFSCSLLPHEGSLYDAGVIREGYSFNQPLDALPIPATKGELPETFSLASCENRNIILETVKKCEADGSMLLRLYDSFGRRSKAGVTVTEGFREVWLCDLMEKPLQQLPFDGRTVHVDVSNFEIITLKFIR